MLHLSVDGLAAERVQTKEVSAELQTLKEEAEGMAEQRVNDRHDFDAVSSFTKKNLTLNSEFPLQPHQKYYITNYFPRSLDACYNLSDSSAVKDELAGDDLIRL